MNSTAAIFEIASAKRPRAHPRRRRRMRTAVRIGVLGLTLAAAALTPRTAHAEAPSGPALIWVGGILLAFPGGAVGLVTDAGIAINLAEDGRVPRGWSIAGTVAWSTATAATMVSLAGSFAEAAEPHPRGGGMAGPIVATSLACLFSAGSLALSIWALGRNGDPRPTVELGGQRLRLSMPLVSPAPSGGSLLLGGTF